MKRIISLLVSLQVLLFCGCERTEPVDREAVDTLNQAIGQANSETRIEGGYMLEITFGDSAVLYYAIGDIAFDRELQRAGAVFDLAYLGSSARMQNYFESGSMISISDGQSMESERDADEVFALFPYFSLPEYTDGCKGLKTTSNTQGTAYSFTSADTKTLCDKIVGADLYELTSVIKKPQSDLTEYSEAECTYTVSDGRIVSARYEFDVKLFDTPAYIPGGQQPESEYTLDLHIKAKVSYDAFGDDASLLEYDDTSSDTSGDTSTDASADESVNESTDDGNESK